MVERAQALTMDSRRHGYGTAMKRCNSPGKRFGSGWQANPRVRGF